MWMRWIKPSISCDPVIPKSPDLCSYQCLHNHWNILCSEVIIFVILFRAATLQRKRVRTRAMKRRRRSMGSRIHKTKASSGDFCRCLHSKYCLSLQNEQDFVKNTPFFTPTLQRHNTKNLKQIFPEKQLCGLSPNFHIHVSVSDFYIPTIGLPILLQEKMWTDPGNI